MARFKDIKSLQKFASAHASFPNHFNQDRHLDRRDLFKQNRSAALAKGVGWRLELSNFGYFGDWIALD